ncbi:hypothetical protein KAR91_08900 [Candidatus Pacearchaeota archaeon]|nr:hypothetical protein [Candidatus Pacearchaeota archaeon]
MNNYFLAAEADIKQLYKKHIGKPVNKETIAALSKDIANYIAPENVISIEFKKSAKGKYYVYPSNLYTLLVLKGIVLPYQLVEGKDSIQIDGRVFSFIDGKCSINTI